MAAPLASAKLPAPVLTDEAKAKAAEAAAKTAWGNKVADYQLCKSMDKAAAKYFATMKTAGKEVKATETPPCADPGPFVAAPPAAAPTTARSGANHRPGRVSSEVLTAPGLLPTGEPSAVGRARLSGRPLH